MGFGAAAEPKQGDVVISLDRATGGEILYQQVFVDSVGATTTLIPCATTSADCLGPVTVQAAWAADPTVSIATTTVEMVPAPQIASLDDCPVGENLMAMRSTSFANDNGTYVDGLIEASLTEDTGNAGYATVYGDWYVVFSMGGLDRPLLPGTYQNANDGRVEDRRGTAIFDLGGPLDIPGCAKEREFQIYEYTWSEGVTSLAATFRMFCTDDPSREITGCARYSL